MFDTQKFEGESDTANRLVVDPPLQIYVIVLLIALSWLPPLHLGSALLHRQPCPDVVARSGLTSTRPGPQQPERPFITHSVAVLQLWCGLVV